MKKTAGFTLVELIVVIAILGILAGIAIPVYSGYIKKANEAADLQQLDAVKTAAVFQYTDDVLAEDTAADIEVTSIDYESEATQATVNGDVTVDISEFTDGVTLKSEKFADGAHWQDGVWTGAGD